MNNSAYQVGITNPFEVEGCFMGIRDQETIALCEEEWDQGGRVPLVVTLDQFFKLQRIVKEPQRILANSRPMLALVRRNLKSLMANEGPVQRIWYMQLHAYAVQNIGIKRNQMFVFACIFLFS